MTPAWKNKRKVDTEKVSAFFRFDEVFIADTPTPLGEFIVLLLILLFAGGMVWVYRKKWAATRNIIGGSLIILLITYLI